VSADRFVSICRCPFPKKKSNVRIASGRLDRDKLKRNPAMKAACIDRLEFVHVEN
jgi:hypothetical protein